MNERIEDRIRGIEDKLGRPIIEILREEEELCKKFPWGMEHPSPFMILPIDDLEFLYENASLFEAQRPVSYDPKAN